MKNNLNCIIQHSGGTKYRVDGRDGDFYHLVGVGHETSGEMHKCNSQNYKTLKCNNCTQDCIFNPNKKEGK